MHSLHVSCTQAKRKWRALYMERHLQLISNSFRSWWLLRWSKHFLLWMEPEGLLCSQGPTERLEPYPVPPESSTHHTPCFLLPPIHSFIPKVKTTSPSKCLRVCHIPHACCIPHNFIHLLCVMVSALRSDGRVLGSRLGDGQSCLACNSRAQQNLTFLKICKWKRDMNI